MIDVCLFCFDGLLLCWLFAGLVLVVDSFDFDCNFGFVIYSDCFEYLAVNSCCLLALRLGLVCLYWLVYDALSLVG